MRFVYFLNTLKIIIFAKIQVEFLRLSMSLNVLKIRTMSNANSVKGLSKKDNRKIIFLKIGLLVG